VVEWHTGETVAVSEGVEEGADDERAGEAAGDEFQGGVRVLHSMCALIVSPARCTRAASCWRRGSSLPHRASSSTRTARDSCSMVVGHWAGRVGAGVDDLELHRRGADLEAVVVDRKRDQAGLEALGPCGVCELGRVLADDADDHSGWRWAMSSTSAGSRRWWAVLNVPSDAVPTVNVRARPTTFEASLAAASPIVGLAPPPSEGGWT
jgi:hypothetical protein